MTLTIDSSVDTARALVERLPQAGLVDLEWAGHLPTLERSHFARDRVHRPRYDVVRLTVFDVLAGGFGRPTLQVELIPERLAAALLAT